MREARVRERESRAWQLTRVPPRARPLPDFEFLFENLTMANVTNASISTKLRRNNTDFLNQDPFKQDIFAEARENF